MEEKTNIPGFYKVDESLVINKDNEALKAYKKRKLKETKLNKMQYELSDVKNDLKEIKELLKGLTK